MEDHSMEAAEKALRNSRTVTVSLTAEEISLLRHFTPKRSGFRGVELPADSPRRTVHAKLADADARIGRAIARVLRSGA